MPVFVKSKWRAAVLLWAGWTFVACAFAALTYTASLVENRQLALGEALRFNLIQFYLWGALSPFLYWFGHRFTIEIRALRFRRLLLYFVMVVLLAVIHQLLNLTLFWLSAAPTRQRFPSLSAYYHAGFGFGFYVDVIIALLITIAVHALLYYRAQAALKTQLAEAQLRALKMQLHPHFLFNTLHSISSLVVDDPRKANAMIARLGDFLRLTLEQPDRQLVSLQEEMAFVRCYLGIEQVRFGDRLTVHYEIEPDTVPARVPHLILQPIVENAIQHAIAPEMDEGQITVAARQVKNLLRLEVRDTGLGMRAGAPSSTGHGMGIRNVRSRLERLYGANYTFEMINGPREGVAVIIEFPLELPDNVRSQ